MKFDRRNVKCYIAHIKCLTAMIIACVFGLKWLKKSKAQPVVVMYSHSLSGNIKAFFDYTLKTSNLPYKTFYITIDKQEYKKLHENYGDKILLATKISVIRQVLNAGIMMTSHGPGIFYLLKWLSPNVKFVDVWHGTPSTNFPLKYWKLYKFYSGLFVSSEYIKKELYIKKRRLSESQLFVTGFARVDRFHKSERIDKLNEADAIALRVRNELNLTDVKHVILFAPTWRPRGKCGEIPFGLSPGDFCGRINDLCEKVDATFILRLHMNSALRLPDVGHSRIRMISQKDYPETNDLLTAVDLLITDYSSIAGDFYVLARPIIYLESQISAAYLVDPLPGISRVGDHVNTFDELIVSTERNLKLEKSAFHKMYSEVLRNCYGDTLDGCSASRYDLAIQKLLAEID